MAYAGISKPKLHFNTLLYSGNGSSQSVTGVGFQPDWVWVKERTSTSSNQVVDAVRGYNKRIQTNSTAAEQVDGSPYNDFKSFDTDGFTVGNGGAVNENSQTYASWNWKANNTSGSSNSDGSITSTVAANTTAGFSIVSYTGNATGGATVGHGLGVVPDLMIVKVRSATNNWAVYHKKMGATKAMYLDQTTAVTSDGWLNNTAPTNQVFTLSSGNYGNSANTHIAYCFAEKKGYSKFGQYTGTGSGSSGAFIYTGFKPAWVMIKPRSFANGWAIFDNKRPGSNVTNDRLEADGSGAESDSLDYLDLLSNGFRIRTSNAHLSNANETLIYVAFAAEPFVANVGNSIPATAF